MGWEVAAIKVHSKGVQEICEGLTNPLSGKANSEMDVGDLYGKSLGEVTFLQVIYQGGACFKSDTPESS
jgi:hypothetical protein